ncbi:hypothetical protein ACOI1C_21915 [Bacillus sp. DJP31]|uniref:hypothetical protein n=1 Tax=Bacillus sp. DJP31 TaxID=3409789 RepID=UPI003BB5B36C
MKKNLIRIVLFITLFGLALSIYFILSGATSQDVHSGMSIIPEETTDLPLYIGLRARSSDYIIKNDQHKEIYDFYLRELPLKGWKLINSRIHKGLGFEQSWSKPSKKRELYILSTISDNQKETYVVFDENSIIQNDIWFIEVKTICEEKNKSEICITIEDDPKAKKFIDFINANANLEESSIKFKDRELILNLTFNNINKESMNLDIYQREDLYFLVSSKGVKEVGSEEEVLSFLSLFR